MQATYIRIRGIVQKVGLRIKIKQIADEMGISGTVKNVEDGSVLILCEAEQAGIDALMRRIRETAEPAVIEDMQVEGTSPATGTSGFDVILGDIQHEMLATMSTGSKILLTITKTLNEMRDTQNEMRDTQNEMRDTQNEMRDTQNEMRDTQNEMRDTQNEMRDTQNEMRDTQNSIDGKMDESLKNKDQTLKILKDMRGSGLLHAVK